MSFFFFFIINSIVNADDGQKSQRNIKGRREREKKKKREREFAADRHTLFLRFEPPLPLSFFFFCCCCCSFFLILTHLGKKNENGGVIFALSLHLFFYFPLNFLLVSFYHQPAMPLSLPLSLSLSYMRRCYNYLFAKGVVVA